MWLPERAGRGCVLLPAEMPPLALARRRQTRLGKAGIGIGGEFFCAALWDAVARQRCAVRPPSTWLGVDRV